MFKVESGIPVPVRLRYPFGELEVGDSFFIPEEEGDTRKAQVNVMSALRNYNSRHTPIKCTTQYSPEGVRVWRIQ